jgi:hypothetical protein
MWLGTGLIAAGCLPLLIYAATPANIAWLLPGFGLIYGATYAVITIYRGDSSPAAVGGCRGGWRCGTCPRRSGVRRLPSADRAAGAG